MPVCSSRAVSASTAGIPASTSRARSPVSGVGPGDFRCRNLRTGSEAPGEKHRKAGPRRAMASPEPRVGLLRCGHCRAGMTHATGRSGRYRDCKCTSRIAAGARSRRADTIGAVGCGSQCGPPSWRLAHHTRPGTGLQQAQVAGAGGRAGGTGVVRDVSSVRAWRLTPHRDRRVRRVAVNGIERWAAGRRRCENAENWRRFIHTVLRTPWAVPPGSACRWPNGATQSRRQP